MSRLSGDEQNAKAQAGIGMSILAGGAVTNLTLTWGIAVALASYNFSDAPATIDTTVRLKKPSRLTGKISINIKIVSGIFDMITC